MVPLEIECLTLRKRFTSISNLPMHSISRFPRPTKMSGYPVVLSRVVSFSNNTQVESRGFPQVRGIAIPPTPVFLGEYAVFLADFFPTVFEWCGFIRFRLTQDRFPSCHSNAAEIESREGQAFAQTHHLFTIDHWWVSAIARPTLQLFSPRPKRADVEKDMFSRGISRVGDFFQNIYRLFSRVFSNAASAKARFLREKRGFFGNSFSRRFFEFAIFCQLPSPSAKLGACHRAVEGDGFLYLGFRFLHFF
jgi:hypothetical protein